MDIGLTGTKFHYTSTRVTKIPEKKDLKSNALFGDYVDEDVSRYESSMKSAMRLAMKDCGLSAQLIDMKLAKWKLVKAWINEVWVFLFIFFC